MLRLSKDGTQLLFLPPEKTQEQELAFPLVYGYNCPKCNNLIEALFITDKKINPKPWEEILTKIQDKDGKFKRIIPGRNDRWHSRYEVKTIGRGSTISAELIRFTEHFEIKEDPQRTPLCGHVVVSSVIPEFRLHDLMIAHGISPAQYKVKDSDYDTIKSKMSIGYPQENLYTFLPAVGKGPEIILADRSMQQWILNMALQPYAKPYEPPIISY